MSDTEHFALVVLLMAVAMLAVLAASSLSHRIRLPLPASVLVAGAMIAEIDPHLRPTQKVVSQVVTVSLVAILFQGGMHLGRTRFRPVAAPVLVIGLAGTFATAGLAAVGLELGFHVGWYPAFLVATAVAPTDPAVVFSLLGRSRSESPATTILEAESGANDPVGIALMAGLIGAGGFGRGVGRAAGHVAGTFFLQILVGAAVGVAGALALRWAMRRCRLPGSGMYPLLTLAGASLLYGLGAVAHGSGFLAVFIGGVILGDEDVPFKAEIDSFHSALSGLGEMVAFGGLGLTVDLHQLSHAHTWLPGLALGLLLAAAIRPAVVWVCLVGGRWRSGDLGREGRRFVQFAGLKGAVPVLLGTYLFESHVADPARLYGIVLVVVLSSVVAQGSLVAHYTSGALALPRWRRRT